MQTRARLTTKIISSKTTETVSRGTVAPRRNRPARILFPILAIAILAASVTPSPLKPTEQQAFTPAAIVWFWGNKNLKRALDRADCREVSWFVRIGTWSGATLLNGPDIPDGIPPGLGFAGLVVKFTPPPSNFSAVGDIPGISRAAVKKAVSAVRRWSTLGDPPPKRVIIEAEHLGFENLTELLMAFREELEAAGLDGIKLEPTVKTGDLLRENPSILAQSIMAVHIVTYPSGDPGAPAGSLHRETIEAAMRAARVGLSFTLVFPGFTTLSARLPSGRTIYPSFDLDEGLFSDPESFTPMKAEDGRRRWRVEKEIRLPAGGRIEPGWIVEATTEDPSEFKAIARKISRHCGNRLTGAGLFPFPLKKSFSPDAAEFILLARELMKMIK